jgi:hypothetical protein
MLYASGTAKTSEQAQTRRHRISTKLYEPREHVSEVLTTPTTEFDELGFLSWDRPFCRGRRGRNQRRSARALLLLRSRRPVSTTVSFDPHSPKLFDRIEALGHSVESINESHDF